MFYVEKLILLYFGILVAEESFGAEVYALLCFVSAMETVP